MAFPPVMQISKPSYHSKIMLVNEEKHGKQRAKRAYLCCLGIDADQSHVRWELNAHPPIGEQQLNFIVNVNRQKPFVRTEWQTEIVSRKDVAAPRSAEKRKEK
jgi:hypothetical protein